MENVANRFIATIYCDKGENTNDETHANASTFYNHLPLGCDFDCETKWMRSMAYVHSAAVHRSPLK